MELYIARHGQTHDNVNDLCSGQNQAQLTALGREQAAALGRYLLNIRLETIWASDLLRVQQTLAAAALPASVPVEYRPELRERNFGQLEGVTTAYYKEFLERNREDPETFRPPGGESYGDLMTRLAPVVDRLWQLAGSCRAMAIFAHGNINRTLLAMLLGGTPGAFTQRPASLNLLELGSERSCRALVTDSIEHLRGV